MEQNQTGSFSIWVSRKMRREIYTVGASATLVLFFFWLFGSGLYSRSSSDGQNAPGTGSGSGAAPGLGLGSHAGVLKAAGSEHPVLQLVQNAEQEFGALRARQSKTLDEAIQEYQRRYGMNPPPKFDKWYEFAKERGTELIDEYDEIYDSLFLFWALKPATIRRRALEVLGEGEQWLGVTIMGVSIRKGVVRTIGTGFGMYQDKGTHEMLSPFAQHLPDMDIAFNTDDEPRVIVPHEDVDRMSKRAHASIQASSKSRDRQNLRFTSPGDLNDGTRYDKLGDSRYNRLEHQKTWAHARLSCPPDSPARTLDDDETDYDTRFAFGDLRFISNMTSFSDVCLVPSVQDFIGLVNHPNVFNLAHDLLPIFTPSKLSTHHDILYPSAYYYADKAPYDESADVAWEKKTAKLYWRGSTTGGYNDGGNWKKLLRQAVVGKFMSPGKVKILEREPSSQSWAEKEVSGSSFSKLFDAQFVQFSQCEGGVCEEMEEFFGKSDRVSAEEVWKHRYLLDMDGNAYSGRFYAFLRSFSLPFKLAYFREWHGQRLIPWKHYVPVSADTNEYTELLRYFEYDEQGQKLAKQIAMDGREWANKVVRKQDMEVYMFRLLLEYARLVDDNRDRLV